MVTAFFNTLVFIIVFASILFIAYVTTRYIGTRTNKAMKGQYIHIVETISLGLDKNIHLIKVGEEFIVVSSSGKNIQYMTTLKLDDYQDGGNSAANHNMFDFKSFFEKYLQAIKNRKSNSSSSQKSSSEITDSMKNDVFRSNLNRLKTMTSRFGNQGREDGDEITNDK